MKIVKLCVAVVLTACIANPASAAVLSSIDQSINGDGNVVNTFTVAFDNQLGTSQLLVELLGGGSIVGATVVENVVTPKPPIVASDNVSFVAQGANTFTGLSNDANPTLRNSSMLTPGASSGLGGPGGAYVFDAGGIDIAWASNPPVPISGSNFLVAQVVLTPAAFGNVAWTFTSGDGMNEVLTTTNFFNGAIPEPSSIGLLLMGLVAMVVRRRR